MARNGTGQEAFSLFGRYTVPTYRVQLVRESAPSFDRVDIEEPEDVAEVFRKILNDADREMFVLVAVDAKNRVIGSHIAHVGTLTMSIVAPREVFKFALLINASALFLGHNHPSGNVEPSGEDVAVTRKLSELGEMMGVEIIDHLIIGEGTEFTSLKERGFMD